MDGCPPYMDTRPGNPLGDPGRATEAGIRYRRHVAHKKNAKNALRAGTLTAVTAALLFMSSPAFAVTRDDGDDPGPGLSVMETLSVFVGLPVLLFLVIAGLVVVGDKSRRQQNG
jgi:hypothetical protein